MDCYYKTSYKEDLGGKNEASGGIKMKCEYMNGYDCVKYGKKCRAHFKTERGNEGINEGLMRVLDCYDGPDKVVFQGAFKSGLESVSSALSKE